MIVIIRDGWIPEKYYDDSETEESDKYLAYLKRNYDHKFEKRKCSEDHPNRFSKAIGID